MAREPVSPVGDAAPGAACRGARGSGLLRVAVLVGLAVAVAPVTLVAAGRRVTPGGEGGRRAAVPGGGVVPADGAAWLVAVVVWPAGRRRRRRAGARAAGAPARAGPGGGDPPGVGPGAVWFRVVAAPYRAWAGCGSWSGTGTAGAVVAVGAARGSARDRRRRAGLGLPALPDADWSRRAHPGRAAAFDERQWRHQVRTARALIAAPGSLPLMSASGQVVVGATIRSVRHRPVRSAAIPYERLRSHQVVIGSTGTGKTTLLLRLWAGFMAAGLRRHTAGTGRRPLLVVLDCKGGGSSRKVADRTRRVLRDAGARSTAIWPDEASLSLWTLPPDRLVTTLLDLIEHGTGGAAYYTE